MGIPIGRLKREITAPQFAMYQAFDNIDPFTSIRADVNNAIVCQILASVNGIKGTDLNQFIYEWGLSAEELAARQRKQLADKLMAWARRVNAAVKAKESEK